MDAAYLALLSHAEFASDTAFVALSRARIIRALAAQRAVACPTTLLWKAHSSVREISRLLRCETHVSSDAPHFYKTDGGSGEAFSEIRLELDRAAHRW